MIKIKVPLEWVENNFDRYKIPVPGQGCEGGGNGLYLKFKALKYGLHLGDVHQRMAAKLGYECCIDKIKITIFCIRSQADFGSLTFPEGYQ